MNKTIIFVIANQKGGVAKTTTAVNLATGFADLNYQTILIDCDPQGNAGPFLGVPQAPGLYQLVIERKPLRDVAQPVEGYPNLALVPGNEWTAEVNATLERGKLFKPETALRDALAPLRGNGRPKSLVIILDTGPSLNALQISALNAADWLIIPATPEFASEMGLAALSTTLDEMHQAGSHLNLLGVLPTMVDSRAKEHEFILEKFQATFPGFVLPPIHKLIALAEAPARKAPIWSYAPTSKAANEYGLVLKEVIKRAKL